jgi:hypothetical protein
MNKKPSLKELLEKHKNNQIEKNSFDNNYDDKIKNISSKINEINNEINTETNNKVYKIIAKKEFNNQKISKPIILSYNNAKKLFNKLPPNLRFKLVSGQEINNLMDLYNELMIMTNEVFNYHVNQYKNDFSKWIKDVLNEVKISENLDNIKDINKFKERLLFEINKIENSSYRSFEYITPDFSYIKQNKYGISNKIVNDNNLMDEKILLNVLDNSLLNEKNKINDDCFIKNNFNDDYYIKIIKSIDLLKNEIELLNKKIDLFNCENKNNLIEIINFIKSEYSLIEDELKHLEDVEDELNKKTQKIYLLEKEIEKKEKEIIKTYNKDL